MGGTPEPRRRHLLGSSLACGHYDTVFHLAWSPDGSLIASASVDGMVQIWRPQA
jgi:WD40 repeat protein